MRAMMTPCTVSGIVCPGALLETARASSSRKNGFPSPRRRIARETSAAKRCSPHRLEQRGAVAARSAATVICDTNERSIHGTR